MKIRNVKRTLKSARVLKGKNLTSKQYFDAVLEYQKALVTVVNNGTTFKEIKNYFENQIVDSDKDFSSLFNTLDDVDRYVASKSSGINGEKMVKKLLGKVDRNCRQLSEITLDDDGERTEYDQILITNNGIMILEVKNYKSPFVINSSGVPHDLNGNLIGKNILLSMSLKRKLLIKKLLMKFKEKGIDMPLNIDEYLVFAQERVEFRNLARGLKYVKPSNLLNVINGYSSNIQYSDDQMQLLETLVYEIGIEEYQKPNFNFKKLNKEIITIIKYINKLNKKQKSSCEILTPNSYALAAC